jgi:hypothetical protein
VHELRAGIGSEILPDLLREVGIVRSSTTAPSFVFTENVLVF